MKTKKNRMRKNKTRKNIYGADKYVMYNIHKSSQISYNPALSCKAIQNILGKNNVSQIHSPPDKNLAKRGIKWIRCLKGMKAEFHFVKPYKIAHDKMLRKIIEEEDHFKSPYQTQFLENHIGMYVPDLTPVIKAVLKYKYNYFLAKRGDGLNHLYVNIPGTLNYLEIDSAKLDLSNLDQTSSVISHSNSMPVAPLFLPFAVRKNCSPNFLTLQVDIFSKISSVFANSAPLQVITPSLRLTPSK